MVERRLLGPAEIALITAIVILTIGGMIYASLTGIIGIPGIPAILADKKITNSPPAAVTTTSPGAEASTEPTAEPSAEASTNPSAPTESNATATPDQKKKDDLAAIQVALTQYRKKHGSYPVSASYEVGRTDAESTPLKVLVTEGYLPSLPIDATAGNYYGYKASRTGYSMTAILEDQSDPEGHFSGSLFVYEVKSL